jgi:hypothetical protein
MNALGRALEGYLALRNGFGHDLAGAARLLPRFVAYLDETGQPTVTIAAAVAWSQQPDADPGTTQHGTAGQCGLAALLGWRPMRTALLLIGPRRCCRPGH